MRAAKASSSMSSVLAGLTTSPSTGGAIVKCSRYARTYMPQSYLARLALRGGHGARIHYAPHRAVGPSDRLLQRM